METKTNVGNFLGENSNRFFKVPAYQRGYKWGVPNPDGKNDAAILMDDILSAMKSDKAEYFIQGVTVYEKDNNIILVDGQQRTTTLFLMLNILMNQETKNKYLFSNGKFKLLYDIRITSKEYLESICLKEFCSIEGNEDDTQDIFYFKVAQNQMKASVDDFIERNRDKEYTFDLIQNFILDKVMLFYIKVNEGQASSVFSMLNGARAFMKTDELIKADFLCKASNSDNKSTNTINTQSIDQTLDILKKQLKEESAKEWDNNAIRSQYAREWDKWLYWWNRPDVKAFFDCGDNPMGLLLEHFFEGKGEYSNSLEKVTSVFKSFQNEFIKDTKHAKENFENLRKLQKKFENLYSRPHFYNYLGLTLSCSIKKDNKEIINYFIENFKDKDKVQKYSLLRIIGATDKEICEENKDVFEEKYRNMIISLSDKFVYTDDNHKENAFRQLFRLNVEAANVQKNKFEFFYPDEKGKLIKFYSYRSLEHIWPKSKVAFKKDGEEIYKTIGLNDNKTENDSEIELQETELVNLILRENIEKKNISEHSIGNLVFLHKTDNSKFNARIPEDKKKVYFNLVAKIYSRNLLHTMSVFAFDNWDKEHAIDNIKANQDKIIIAIKDKYDVYVN